MTKTKYYIKILILVKIHLDMINYLLLGCFNYFLWRICNLWISYFYFSYFLNKNLEVLEKLLKN